MTATKEAAAGWKEAQDDLASLSTNSLHRILRNTFISWIRRRRETQDLEQAPADVVGVPEINPVPALTESPAGSPVASNDVGLLVPVI